MDGGGGKAFHGRKTPVSLFQQTERIELLQLAGNEDDSRTSRTQSAEAQDWAWLGRQDGAQECGTQNSRESQQASRVGSFSHPTAP